MTTPTSQHYAMNCGAQAANHPAHRTERTTWILPDKFCGSLVRKGHLSKHQLTGLEEKQNFAGVYEKRITYFLYHQGQKKTPSPDYLRS